MISILLVGLAFVTGSCLAILTRKKYLRFPRSVRKKNADAKKIMMLVFCFSLAIDNFPLWNFGTVHYWFWDVGWGHLLSAVALVVSLMLYFRFWSYLLRSSRK